MKIDGTEVLAFTGWAATLTGTAKISIGSCLEGLAFICFGSA
ncbi:hypothetical protein [Rhizobium lusitanum]|nr:hypothetical protein [Rhizobium lusitanum]